MVSGSPDPLLVRALWSRSRRVRTVRGGVHVLVSHCVNGSRRLSKIAPLELDNPTEIARCRDCRFKRAGVRRETYAVEDDCNGQRFPVVGRDYAAVGF